MMLLDQTFQGQLEIEMIAGGCDEDCHRRRFKTKLIAMKMQGFDHIIVEPSGIYDVDEFFDVLHEIHCLVGMKLAVLLLLLMLNYLITFLYMQKKC